MQRKYATGLILLASLLGATAQATAQSGQRPLATEPAAPAHRTRLILKDGSYQVVMSYQVVGKVVRYVSAERGGETEEIPLELVDLPATERWQARHATPDEATGQPPVLDPELAREEADRAARTPEVAHDLRLDTDSSALVLDTYQGTPELIPLTQASGDLNRQTSHNVLRGLVNPFSAPHQIIEINGEKAAVQLHVDSPVFYLRVGDDPPPATGGTPLVVDTHGARGQAETAPSGGSAESSYVVVRTDVRIGLRVVQSFRISLLGVRPQPDVVECTVEPLPGKHWMKITPQHTLDFGEYALLEVLSDHEVNLGVWDFGVHPVAPENRDAIRPQPRRPASLERRRSRPDDDNQP
ncbi:MAG: hypothetical protein KGK08_07340 [Acidobacteriota bacterium]|nr:hypothetical protein [Acidobacteriota bacterium]